MTFALVGNQNSGKTTLFNQLTGGNQHVGNFPGVTVEQKSGQLRGSEAVTIVDLPGIYSLSPYTSEERVTRDFIIKQKPDGIINIVDVMNIERNLYLTLQVIELGVPMVLALNMMDEWDSNGGIINLGKFAQQLGIPVIPISAAKNQGIDELISTAIEVVSSKAKPSRVDFCEGAVHRCLHAIAHLIEDHAGKIGVPGRFASTKLIEGDPIIEKSLLLSDNERQTVEHCIKEMEAELGTDREAALADMRYRFIESVCCDTLTKPAESREEMRSTTIDKVLTHKYLGIPIFLAVMLGIFWLTFGVIGSGLSELLSLGINELSSLTEALFIAAEINPFVQNLVINGIFAGVGAVMSFLPIIVTLFFFLSLLEDLGYMARVSFIMDKALRKLGLSGKSFVPMLIGFGCSVPAIMATRTLHSGREKRMTIMLIPFISCSAKLPIYALLSATFFAPAYAPLVMLALYAGGIIIGIPVGLILKKTLFRGRPAVFIMELPPYRIPSLKSVWLLVRERAKDFIERAFTVIFAASLIIWLLQTVDFRLNLVANPADSILAAVGGALARLFTPLGFGDWRAVTALISGFTAKEAVVSTLAVLTNTSVDNLPAALTSFFTPLSALSFLAFTLLYTPCVAAIAAVKREINLKWAAAMVTFQLSLAWAAGAVVYQLGRFF